VWYRKDERGKKQLLEKYCFDCNNPIPIWFKGKCPYCEAHPKKNKIKGLKVDKIIFDEIGGK
jgi:hypothetical protein